MERFLQVTGWTLELCSSLSTQLKFQCLLLDDGHMPEWLEGRTPHNAGVESFSWQILEDNVPHKFFLSPAECSCILRYATNIGCQIPLPIEYILQKQGGSIRPLSTQRTPTPWNIRSAIPKRLRKTIRSFSHSFSKR